VEASRLRHKPEHWATTGTADRGPTGRRDRRRAGRGISQRLVGYKIPRSFEYVELPLRDDADKIRRSELRAERLSAAGPFVVTQLINAPFAAAAYASGMHLDPVIARRTYRTVEPIHAMIYFAPVAHETYQQIGLRGQRMGYFASRSAPMGRVPAEVAVATFYNFNPAVVRRAIPAAWELASPDTILAARLDAADKALRQAWGELVGGPEVEQAAVLARRAAEQACLRPQGRPLFAGHASLAWPDEAHLVLWHAESLLREYRGDGHVSLLLTEGIDPVEALVIHAAAGEAAADAMRLTRAWGDDDWQAAVERLRARGWLEAGDELRLSESGQVHRQSVEDRTDELATWPYEAIGEDGCAQLRLAARPLSRSIVDAGLFFGLPFDGDGDGDGDT